MERATRGRKRAVVDVLSFTQGVQGDSQAPPVHTTLNRQNTQTGTHPGEPSQTAGKSLPPTELPIGPENADMKSDKSGKEVLKGVSHRRTIPSATKEERIRGKQAELFRCHNSSWIDRVPEAPTFRPTLEEFERPMEYISKIQAQVAPWGICKIVPPMSAAVPGATVLLQQGPFRFTTRQQGLRQPLPSSLRQLKFLSSGKEYSIVSFEKAANEFSYRRYNMANGLPSRFVEAEYWREHCSGSSLTVEYGNDVEGTAFSSESWDPMANSRWACDKISLEHNSVLRLLPHAIPGVTTPMLYIGMLFSTFAWHVEDLYLYSINFHHFGAPKTWYGVPDTDADAFEELVMNQVYNKTKESATCSRSEFAREAVRSMAGKTTMFSPEHLLDAGVKVCRCVQNAGEFVITFPRSYHAGFSHGYNCGEAVNFGMADWFQYGMAAAVRHSLLQTVPILSVEGLLCTEASQMSVDEECREHHQLTTQALFLRLMMFQNSLREWICATGTICCAMSAGQRRVITCHQCWRLCFLGAVLPDKDADDDAVLCLQCGIRWMKASGQARNIDSLMVCYPGLNRLEANAKLLQRQCKQGSPLRNMWDDTGCHSKGRSDILGEQEWWKVPEDFGCRRCTIDYEWAELDMQQMPDSRAWSNVAQSLSSESSTTSSNADAKTPTPKVDSKPQKTSGKRKHNMDKSGKGKAHKQRTPVSTWQRALQHGSTGQAVEDALTSADVRTSTYCDTAECQPKCIVSAAETQFVGDTVTRREVNTSHAGDCGLSAAIDNGVAEPSQDSFGMMGINNNVKKGSWRNEAYMPSHVSQRVEHPDVVAAILPDDKQACDAKHDKNRHPNMLQTSPATQCHQQERTCGPLEIMQLEDVFRDPPFEVKANDSKQQLNSFSTVPCTSQQAGTASAVMGPTQLQSLNDDNTAMPHAARTAHSHIDGTLRAGPRMYAKVFLTPRELPPSNGYYY